MRLFALGFAMLFASAVQGVSATEIQEFAHPIPSKLEVEAILCKHPESLFLIYEGGSMAMAGGGKDAFKSFFTSAGSVLEQAGECQVEVKAVDVLVTGFAALTNPVKQPSGEMIYGRFKHPQLNTDVFAMLGNLPGLRAEVEKLEAKPAEAAQSPAKPRN